MHAGCTDRTDHSCVTIARLASEYATKLEETARTLGVENRALAEMRRMSTERSITPCAQDVYRARADELSEVHITPESIRADVRQARREAFEHAAELPGVE